MWTGAESWQLAVELRVPVAHRVHIVLKHQVTTETERIRTSFPVATYVELSQARRDPSIEAVSDQDQYLVCSGTSQRRGG